MSKTLYFSFEVTMILLLSGFGLFFAYIQKIHATVETSSTATVQNTIIVNTNTGNGGQNGTDGADGEDGAEGTSVINGKAKSSVQVRNIINGEEQASTTIQIETSSGTTSVIQKSQNLQFSDGTEVQNEARGATTTSSSTETSTNDLGVDASAAVQGTGFIAAVGNFFKAIVHGFSVMVTTFLNLF